MTKVTSSKGAAGAAIKEPLPDAVQSLDGAITPSSVARPFVPELVGDKKWQEYASRICALEAEGKADAAANLIVKTLNDPTISAPHRRGLVGLLFSPRGTADIGMATLKECRNELRWSYFYEGKDRLLKRDTSIVVEAIQHNVQQILKVIEHSRQDTKELDCPNYFDRGSALDRAVELSNMLVELEFSQLHTKEGELISMAVPDPRVAKTLLSHILPDIERHSLPVIKSSLQFLRNCAPTTDPSGFFDDAARTREWIFYEMEYADTVIKLIKSEDASLRILGANEGEFYVMKFPERTLYVPLMSLLTVEDPIIRSHLLWNQLERTPRGTTDSIRIGRLNSRDDVLVARRVFDSLKGEIPRQNYRAIESLLESQEENLRLREAAREGSYKRGQREAKREERQFNNTSRELKNLLKD